MSVIYLRTNKINGKKYVGQTRDLKTRQNNWKHISQHYAGKAIYNARKKYGIEAFDFEILKECKDDELDYWEMYYIKEFNTRIPNGYNITEGGNSGFPHTEETKQKISEKNKGRKHSEEWKKNHSEQLKGRHPSEETKKKMSESQKGIHHSEEHKKKISETKKGIPNIKLSKSVFQIDKNTNEIIAEFPSVMEVQRQLHFRHGHISQCCRGERKSAYGYIWKYKYNILSECRFI